MSDITALHVVSVCPQKYVIVESFFIIPLSKNGTKKKKGTYKEKKKKKKRKKNGHQPSESWCP